MISFEIKIFKFLHLNYDGYVIDMWVYEVVSLH